MRLILASRSPRRRELIGRLTDDFIAVDPDVPETEAGEAEQIAMRNSLIKAETVSRTHPGLVLGADTVVALDGEVLFKPKDDADAAGMLKKLRGRTHRVVTGVTLTDGNKTVTAAETTRVTFGAVPDGVIAEYVQSGYSNGKAGAYGIQDAALAGYITYDGDYDNVVGLPVALVRKLMKEFQ